MRQQRPYSDDDEPPDAGLPLPVTPDTPQLGGGAAAARRDPD